MNIHYTVTVFGPPHNVIMEFTINSTVKLQQNQVLLLCSKLIYKDEILPGGIS